MTVGLMLAIGLLGASARGAVQPLVLLNADRLEAPDRYLYGNPRLNSGWVSEGAAFRHQLTAATGMMRYAFGLAAPAGCALRVEATVRDAERCLPPKGRPWAGDGLDLYIDPMPFADLSQKRAKSVQLYAFPDGTTRAMEETFVGREVVSAVTATADGYSVVLTVPWSAFGCGPQRAIGFNLIHNDFAADGSKKLSRVWCDGAPPYVSRFTWALVE